MRKFSTSKALLHSTSCYESIAAVCQNLCLKNVDSTSICDAAKNNELSGKIQILSHELRPRHQKFQGVRLLGPAFTVSAEDDFLSVFEALKQSKSGDVLMINTRGSTRAVAGEIFVSEAQRKKLGGIIIDGACRDTSNLHKINFPIYSTLVNPYSGTFAIFDSLQKPNEIGGKLVNPGDLIFGDDDGVLNLGQDCEVISFLVEQAQKIKVWEEEIIAKIKKGTPLSELL